MSAINQSLTKKMQFFLLESVVFAFFALYIEKRVNYVKLRMTLFRLFIFYVRRILAHTYSTFAVESVNNT